MTGRVKGFKCSEKTKARMREIQQTQTQYHSPEARDAKRKAVNTYYARVYKIMEENPGMTFSEAREIYKEEQAQWE
ncbi:MAG: hypothetical protein DRP93_00165 [Candidatus Neomarinimicrobiota bacterium]|nr:MAG: hypothetical protein DRP93_00165 [Candidatus Neomarinimicrobiota bacterium]